MSRKATPTETRTKSPDAARAARLQAALKANIAKRKAQARARDTGTASVDGSDKEQP